MTFPFPAFLIGLPTPANGYGDAVSVRLCYVEAIDRAAGVAVVRTRCGLASQVHRVPFDRVAKTERDASAKIAAQLSTLSARAALPSVPVMTAGSVKPSTQTLAHV